MYISLRDIYVTFNASQYSECYKTGAYFVRCEELSEGNVQMLQSCMPYLNNNKRNDLGELMVARLISSPVKTLLNPDGRWLT